jgi:ABC-type glycerol-3-phosphate transport system permease component
VRKHSLSRFFFGNITSAFYFFFVVVVAVAVVVLVAFAVSRITFAGEECTSRRVELSV